ncbi:hypothetical protein K466DRAFT_71769 [Polyporus arcularius HHB13444]|uniref:Uncharacterized protein n=1 Tax=Polyporus arcularius HHB13444 TaxID=1314778 RepID=A0A5C3PVA7_9APHY|nr:hypothetical protein K466DRAFT_71769 [Polyporus arcularius HHB13444]
MNPAGSISLQSASCGYRMSHTRTAWVSRTAMNHGNTASLSHRYLHALLPQSARVVEPLIAITVSGISYTRLHPREQIKPEPLQQFNDVQIRSPTGKAGPCDVCRPAAPRKHDWSPASATAMVYVPWRACGAGRPHCRRVLGSAARDAISVIDEANSIRVAVTENQRVRTASLCSHALSPRGTLSQSDSDMLSPPGPWRWGVQPASRATRPAVCLRHASSASSWGASVLGGTV